MTRFNRIKVTFLGLMLTLSLFAIAAGEALASAYRGG
jgi:hypothetical protein